MLQLEEQRKNHLRDIEHKRLKEEEDKRRAAEEKARLIQQQIDEFNQYVQQTDLEINQIALKSKPKKAFEKR
jgi:hypothetical protein